MQTFVTRSVSANILNLRRRQSLGDVFPRDDPFPLNYIMRKLECGMESAEPPKTVIYYRYTVYHMSHMEMQHVDV